MAELFVKLFGFLSKRKEVEIPSVENVFPEESDNFFERMYREHLEENLHPPEESVTERQRMTDSREWKYPGYFD